MQYSKISAIQYSRVPLFPKREITACVDVLWKYLIKTRAVRLQSWLQNLLIFFEHFHQHIAVKLPHSCRSRWPRFKPTTPHLNMGIATAALCDAAHRLQQGVLYFRNVIRFHGTRVSVTIHDHEKVHFQTPVTTEATDTQ